MSNLYNPITAVWEITMGCNLRCKHCGSSCENALEGELITQEALKLCDEMKLLGLKWITLSGGEPTTREDWNIIASRLSENGIIPNMITNGWLMDDEIIKKAKSAGINTIAISLDGLQKTHDHIRKKGSFDKIMKSFDIITGAGINCSVITTINSFNINELEEMHGILSKKNLFGWQIQLGLPMGNMAHNNELVSSPEHIDRVIEFAYNSCKKGGIEIQLADCIGYFNNKEIEVRKAQSGNDGEYGWVGCGAGKHNFGILHNGDVVGCTSIRSKEFIEGNVKETSIIDIWNNDKLFAWNRELTKDKLKGLCSKCINGSRCLGGCANTRLTMDGSVYGENRYCSYNNAVKRAEEHLNRVSDSRLLLDKSRTFIKNNSFQLAGIVLEKVIEADNNNCEALALYGFASFMLGNYIDAKNSNEKLLSISPTDPYALKGYGLSIAKLGDVEEGISYLKKSIEFGAESFLDPYHDLAVLLYENGRIDDAISILDKGRSISQSFRDETDDFYKMLLA
ncbi:MAG TPA: radical SAM protein [Pseudobacteroides sp.]|uniref:radical SAM/SPASM domain-containing protein n=1 Tax=Pseudobacteroides sp. TaxID=1968840 RepID=UPI002F92DA93